MESATASRLESASRLGWRVAFPLEWPPRSASQWPPLAQLEQLSARSSRAMFGTGTRFDAFPTQGVDWQAVGFEKVGRVTARPGDEQRLAVSTGLAWAVIAARLHQG